MIRPFIFLFAFLSFTTLQAVHPGNEEDSLSLEMTVDDEDVANFLDSMLIQLHEAKDTMTTVDNSYSVNDTLPLFYPDSIYIDRIIKLNSYIKLSYNEIVRNFIHVYTHRKKGSTERILGLKEYYFPIFEEILDRYQLPQELKYVPVIESALNTRAVSRAGATGLWQFMYGTGRMYGLTINSFIDERRDPAKATDAACRYFSDLYKIYKDWTLVIAAYNCGPGNVNKAIRRTGGKRDYWEIYYYLPRETRGYVPAFIGAMYALNYAEEHNIQPVSAELPSLVDTLTITKDLHFMQVVNGTGISLDMVRDLNPQYRADIIPGSIKPYALCLPYSYSALFIDNQDSIFASKDTAISRTLQVIKQPEKINNSNYYHAPPSSNHSKVYYTVKDGDNLGFISEWFNVRLSDLRYWNNIRGNMIRRGQKLVVYVPKSKYDKYNAVNTMTFEQKQRMIGKETVQANNSNSSAISSSSSVSSDYEYYQVKKGDTLWDIAKKYPGISDTDIMKLNNLSETDKLTPGQVLKIRKK